MAKAKQEIIEHSVVRDENTQNIQEKPTNTGVKLSSTGILAFVFIAVVISLAAGAFSFVLFNQLAQNKNELDALKVEIGGQLNGKLDGVSGKFNSVTDRFTNVSDRISRFNDEVKNINNDLKQQNANFNQSVHKLDTTINQKFTKLDATINQKVQQQNSNIKSQLGLIENIDKGLKNSLRAQEISNEQITRSIDKLYKQKGRTRNDWILSEVEYLLLIANHGLLLLSDTNTAIIALESADARLLDMGDPGIINIRKSIADELIKLKAVPQIDISGMQITLSGMIKYSTTLPVLNSEVPSVADLLEPNVLEKAPANSSNATTIAPNAKEAAPIPQSYEYYKAIVVKASDKFIHELKNLVVYRNAKVAATALVAPEQKFFLQQHVSLKLESARKALLDGKNDLFHSLLAETESLLKQYFNTNKQSVKSFQAQITSLQSQNLTRNLPDISFSLFELKKYVAQLEEKRSTDKIDSKEKLKQDKVGE